MTIKERMDKYISQGLDKDEALDKSYNTYKTLEYQKRIRLDKRIENIVKSNEGYFFTLTFNNQNIDKYSEDKLHKFAVLWCRKYLLEYVGNRDYGDLNGRFHIHVVGIPKKEFANTWRYGAINFEKIYNEKHKAIRNYILKIVNHAVKKSASKIFRSKTFNLWRNV